MSSQLMDWRMGEVVVCVRKDVFDSSRISDEKLFVLFNVNGLNFRATTR